MIRWLKGLFNRPTSEINLLDLIDSFELNKLRLDIYSSENSHIELTIRYPDLTEFIKNVNKAISLVNKRSLTGYNSINSDLVFKKYLTDFISTEDRYITTREIDFTLKRLRDYINSINQIKELSDVESLRIITLTNRLTEDVKTFLFLLKEIYRVENEKSNSKS